MRFSYNAVRTHRVIGGLTVYDSEKNTTSTDGESYQSLSEEDLSKKEEPRLGEKRIRKPPERYGLTNLCISVAAGYI